MRIIEEARAPVFLDDSPTLTDREKDVLLWAAHGKTSAEIAEILGRPSTDTVEQHFKKAMRKLERLHTHPGSGQSSVERHDRHLSVIARSFVPGKTRENLLQS